MTFLIAIAAIGIILFTLPLLLGLFGAILGIVFGLLQWVLGAAILFGGLYFVFSFFSENPQILIGIVSIAAIALLMYVVVKTVTVIGSLLFPNLPEHRTSEVLGPKKKVTNQLSETAAGLASSRELDEEGNEIFGGLDTDDWPDTAEIIGYICKNGLSLENLENAGISSKDLENPSEPSDFSLPLADRLEKATDEKKLKDLLEHISEIQQFIWDVGEQQKWLLENFEDLLLVKSNKGETLPLSFTMKSIISETNVPRVSMVKFSNSLSALGLIKWDFRQKMPTRGGFTVEIQDKIYDIVFKSSPHFDDLVEALSNEKLSISIEGMEHFKFARKSIKGLGHPGQTYSSLLAESKIK